MKKFYILLRSGKVKTIVAKAVSITKNGEGELIRIEFRDAKNEGTIKHFYINPKAIDAIDYEELDNDYS